MVGQEPNEIWMVLHGINEKKQCHKATGGRITLSPSILLDEWTPTQLTWLIDGIYQKDEVKRCY